MTALAPAGPPPEWPYRCPRCGGDEMTLRNERDSLVHAICRRCGLLTPDETAAMLGIVSARHAMGGVPVTVKVKVDECPRCAARGLSIDCPFDGEIVIRCPRCGRVEWSEFETVATVAMQ